MVEETFYVQDGDSAAIGPVTTQLVIEGVRHGRIRVSARICAVGSSEWMPLAAHPLFAAVVREAAPPPPPRMEARPPPAAHPALPTSGAGAGPGAAPQQYGQQPPPQGYPPQYGQQLPQGYPQQGPSVLGCLGWIFAAVVFLFVAWAVVYKITGERAKAAGINTPAQFN